MRDTVQPVFFRYHPEVGRRRGHRAGHAKDGGGASPAALRGVVDGDEVVSANVLRLPKEATAVISAIGGLVARTRLLCWNRCCARGHAKEGPSSVTDEQGRVGGCAHRRWATPS